MLIAGKWGDSWVCPVCSGSNSGASLKCHRCEYKTLDTSPERVENTATNLQHGCIGHGSACADEIEEQTNELQQTVFR